MNVLLFASSCLHSANKVATPFLHCKMYLTYEIFRTCPGISSLTLCLLNSKSWTCLTKSNAAISLKILFSRHVATVKLNYLFLRLNYRSNLITEDMSEKRVNTVYKVVTIVSYPIPNYIKVIITCCSTKLQLSSDRQKMNNKDLKENAIIN